MVQSTRPSSDIMFEDLARLVKQEEEVAIQVLTRQGARPLLFTTILYTAHIPYSPIRQPHH